MSVYTSVSDREFSEILKSYNLGNFISAQGIQAGIENTNYFLTTSQGEYVFTLFEKINQQELGFYISLLQELSQADISCPQPQVDINDCSINEIKSKPFTLVSRLKGKNLTSANIEQCKAIAIELAKLHTLLFSATHSANNLLPNRRGKAWREETAKNLMAHVSAYEANLISSEIKFYQSFDDSNLPRGIIHADLFKDNALFENDRLSGIIDFYDACYDTYLYDMAITVNAWCIDENKKLNEPVVNAFLKSYQSIRPLTEPEAQAWPIMLRMAAMRFWLSRLEDSFSSNNLTPTQDTLTHSKNPMEYQKILEHHIKSAVD
ncbi:MAG: homoserine kinase [Gammaproteobacteria bacterium]|nr:homoserine kinase [Gammaproteobacteria bacterium]MCW8988726.1 homoserine kinase [Gammaproteobacteria bacterium]